ncbi:hypothetical protein EJ02DRAFT_470217 [Clathrospora elynae]|uniref:Uncharacterized protein n=1 Tax=Clathrospora elynae TaxID=706981 RepID=A0A6A5S818_9PLEO|nr:hypothetical protein EJ02DRAFT_470217 [Clathrospora elynae]
MNSQQFPYTPLNEPSVVVNVTHTEIEASMSELSYPPESSMKRRISETVSHTRDYFLKRRRRSENTHGAPADCFCSPPPLYLETFMSEPTSAMASNYSTLPTSPAEGASPASEHQRRPSQIAELMDKLKRLFKGRRDATDEAEDLLASHSGALNSSISDNADDPTEPYNVGVGPELVRHGMANLPKVSLYFDATGEAGPSDYYNTADWDKFQTRVRDGSYDADWEVDNPSKAQPHSTQNPESEKPRKRKRKDSQFSFGGLWSRSRRPSKEDKGKGRQLSEDQSPTSSQLQQAQPQPPPGHTSNAIVLPLTEIGLLPRASTNETSLSVPRGSHHIPEADFSSSRSSIASMKLSALASPNLDNSAPKRVPAIRKQSIRLVTPPPPGRPEVNPESSVGSSASSTSISSVESSGPAGRSAPRVKQMAPLSPIYSSINTEAHSLPLDIPSSNTGSRHTSLGSGVLGTATSYQLLAARAALTVIDSREVSTSSLVPHHGNDPDDAAPPSSSPPGPMHQPYSADMQSLDLGPHEHQFLQRSGPNEFVSLLSANQVASLSGLSAFSSLGEGEVEDEHENVSMTDSSPPSSPSSSSQPGSDSLKRRQGSLRASEDLHWTFLSQSLAPPSPEAKRGAPRKSLSKNCWWGGRR